MPKWIFLEDFDLIPKLDQIVNLASVVSISLRLEDAQLIFFFVGGHLDPHILTFQSQELCQTAYDNLKTTLRAEQ